MRGLIAGLILAMLSTAEFAHAGVSIILDYSLDSNGFFTPERRAIAQAAATSLTSRMANTTWARVDTSATGGSYELAMINPSTLAVSWMPNVVIPENQITVHLGAMDWSTAPVAKFRASSGDSVTQLVSIRNASGGIAAVLASPSKLRPVNASISFDLQGIQGLKSGITRQWYFGSAANLSTDDRNPADPYYSNYVDFYTSLIHELGHILGIYDASAGSSTCAPDETFCSSIASDSSFYAAWTSRVQADGQGGYVFTGARASQFYYNHVGQPIPLDTDTLCHWAVGVRSQSQDGWTSVTHESNTPFRYGFSELEFGALEDMGYTITPAIVLEMPWFTQVSGYISRFVLLNTGSSAATFNTSILTEAGNSAQTNSANSSGSIPANQQYVVNASDLVYSFSAGQRAAAIFTSNAPAGTLSGIYNLVQPTTGAISSVSLLRGQDFTSSSSVLVAPWFSTASGYNSAFIFSNYGNTDATATVSFLAPNGTTVMPKLGSLNVPAQGQLVVDTSTLASMTGSTDGAAVFSLNAPEGNVKGTYKIVSAVTGTANSTEMVNPQSASGSTTRLVAPWFSTAPGYTSSFILTNRGSTVASYTVMVMTETGNTATTSTLTGSILAGSQIILPASSIVSGFTGATRAAAIFDVNALPADIEGVYKIVSQGTGAVSMTILSRADSSGSSTTTLKLPWFSGASGYVSRFVLVNSGSTAAPFTLQVFPESGNFVTQTTTNGAIPAQGQLVLPVADVISGFGGATRAAAIFSVSAPASDIYGLYNIVNPTSGSISNTMMGK